jgi:type IV secretory pathway VirB4 component
VIELRIVVWQFVRIMVQFETEASRARRSASVYRDWREAWEELDARLTDLGKSDVAAYSNLMMDQEVVVKCRDQAQLDDVIQAVDRVIKRLGDEIARKQGKLKDLRFEQRELKTLRRELEATGVGH